MPRLPQTLERFFSSRFASVLAVIAGMFAASLFWMLLAGN
jgi:hypothetical protein